jgi:phosphoribosylaminoimidazole-succinocarboxamide synthase
MALYESKISSLPRLGKGKVRDIYAVGADKMLIVTSDRLSAFDVVLSDPIPDKGRVLNEMANFWFGKLGHIVPNQLTDLPKGLQQAQKLPQPIFTPATKAETGHDENISFDEVVKLIGKPMAEKVRDISIRLYKEASEYAATKGIIIADTKFEFGLNEKNEVVLIDEVLTADSSRFWPADSYQVGVSPPSYDKQYVRDYLETLDWDKTPPAPKLPGEVIARTAEKYREALQRLTGKTLA